MIFYRKAPTSHDVHHVVHNLSSLTLSPDEVQLLSKGLSFSSTPDEPLKKSYFQLLDCFDSYARSVRQKYVHAQYHPYTPLSSPTQETETSMLYRRMKFLPSSRSKTITQQFSGIHKVEHYIKLTKNNINDQLPVINLRFSSNVTDADKATLKKFKNEVTIKLADKNLGLVLLNTDDYIAQCSKQLSDTETYRLANEYPREDIKIKLINTIVSFKSHAITKSSINSCSQNQIIHASHVFMGSLRFS